MKIEIHNLGAIEQAQIDLKPLTVFVGASNTGKTWVAYLLSAILGPDGWEQYTRAYADDKLSETYPPLDNAIEQVLNEGNTKIDLVQFANKYGEVYVNGVAHLARHWLPWFLDTEQVSFEHLTVQMRLTETKEHFLERIKTYATEGKLSAGRQRDGALLRALKEQGEPTIYLYTSTERSVLDKLPLRAVREFLAEKLFELLHKALYPHIYTFPTERATFITIPPLVESGKTSRTNWVYEPEQRVRVTRPVGYFLDLVGDTFWNRQSMREEQANNDAKIRTYIQLAQLLESEILGGSMNFSTPEPEPHRELLFQTAKGIKLEMPITSSMIKELSPLVLYLRYLAQPGELIIIDEPEMNLHPEAQARLTEFLAMLVQAGLHILFTTHSPYIVDHLSNLMKAAKHDEQGKIKELFYLKQTEAFVPQEKVSIYLFKNGTTRNIMEEDGLIDWDTFGEVSDRISQIYFDI